jgi:ribosomal subunit interface protein
MQIQVRTDNHIAGSERLTEHVETVVADALSRFGTRVTRVEVHLSDENAHKTGGADKRCALEARLAGMQPIAVTASAATLNQAIDAASDKLQTALDRAISRKEDPKGRSSAAGE